MSNHGGAGPRLRLVSKSSLSTSVSGSLLACNNVIDLMATVGDRHFIYFWRPGEQQVSKHSERNQTVTAIRWKEDGEFLAAGWSDGVVRLIGLESSKAVHHIRVNDGTSEIEFIAWSRNLAGRRLAQTTPARQLPKLKKGKAISNLPRDLMFLETETALPKLSPLPVSGGSGDDMFVFSTTSSLDFVFRPCNPDDADTVHVMIVGTADGAINLSMYDSFVIGTFNPLPQTGRMTVPPRSSFQLCGHASHPDISTHSLLLRPKESSSTSLYVVPMDLTFVFDSPVHLSLLASRTTTLQNLLRYLKQALTHMVSEYKSTRELPRRFLSSLQEDLQQKNPRGPVSVVAALTHTAATGDVFAPMKEWLVDTLAERGHKRWDKAVVSGLENLRALVHENFIPALERCGIILSRLRGIARFHDARESIGFTDVKIKGLMDIVSCLALVSHKIKDKVMDELEYFSSFSIWLRMEIDRLASSAASEDLTEREVNMDHGKVLRYIETYLEHSPLGLYFDETAKEDFAKDLEIVEMGSPLLDMLDKQIKRHESQQVCMKALPNVGFLVDYLTKSAGVVFGDIAEAQKRGVRFGQATEITLGEKIWKHDIHVLPSRKDGVTTAATFTAVVLEAHKNQIFNFRSVTEIINGISGIPVTTVYGVELPDDSTIIDFKYLDDTTLLVLCRQKGEHVLLRTLYRSKQVVYTNYEEGRESPSDIVGRTDQSAVSWITAKLSAVTGLAPVRMEVQGGNRVCLMGRDKCSYRTYGLPENWDEIIQ